MLGVKVRIEFDHPLQPWDGFGVNYVETAQTRDYARDPQDYGGFSTLSEQSRQEIIDLIFGDNGLRPGLVKMFLDPFHQSSPGDESPQIDDSDYDHETTTRWQRYFVREGLKRTRTRGGNLTVLTDLYGPPGFMTQQKMVCGRDLDPAMKQQLAKYICAYAKFLREREGFPVKFVGLHNEGECWPRWPDDGCDNPSRTNHDYNMFWTPEQVVEFLPRVRAVLDANGMQDVGVTPGETTTWFRFHIWGFADAIADNPAALASLGLITSHGFAGGWAGRWYGDWRSAGIDILRAKRPELHAWVTSTSWSNMDAAFLWEQFNAIYSAKVNGIIPWAAIQYPPLWIGGDPNPGNAIQVDGKGGYEIRAGYWYYKNLCRAGQPGMAVARVRTNESRVLPIAFASAGSGHPDAFVVVNVDESDFEAEIEIRGSTARQWQAFRTCLARGERFESLGTWPAKDNRLRLSVPAGSATTCFAVTER